MSLKEDFTYIPRARLHFAKQKTKFPITTYTSQSWDATHGWLQKEQFAMPTILEFVQTLKYLKGNQFFGRRKELYNEIVQSENNGFGVWLDAYFEKREDGFYVLTGNKTKAEKLDKNTLMEDRTPGISLDSWLSNPTSQGLPRKNVAEGDLHYWSVSDGLVSMFKAGVGTCPILFFQEFPQDDGLVYAVKRD